jgi:hypothetical protein
MPVWKVGSAEVPGPLFGLTMAQTETVGCAFFAAVTALHEGSVG